jgi:cytochrome c oxidase cbb3-type subunit III
MMRNLLRPTLLLLVLLLGLAWFAPGLAQSGDDQLEEGAALYLENCLVCHGEMGQGRVGATLAKNWPSIRPDLTIRNVIAVGVEGSPMPGWSQQTGGPLTDEQIDSLVAYILSWESGEPFEYVPAWTPTSRPPITPVAEVEGEPNRGAVLYDQNCTVCHGAEGQGRAGATLARDWPSIRPDLSVRNVIAIGVAGSPMPAWSQANGGPLSDQDIADITAFILTLPAARIDSGLPIPTSVETTGRMGGVTGVVVTLALFALVVSLILFVQRKK